jgi:hypothetical protein
MKVPNFEDLPVVDKAGKFTPEWKQILSELFTQMQKNLSDEGLTAPAQSTANIASLTGTEKNGAILYDSDTDQLKVNLNGVIKTVTTS